jgi:large subunit ribosomal protein L21
MFAIIETSGTQYKVEKGNILDVNRIHEEEGKSIDINEVLLLEDNGKTNIGTPYINGAHVQAKVVAHKRGDKIVVFKMKAKKRYQKTQGHRQDLTTIEITEIKTTGGKAKEA